MERPTFSDREIRRLGEKLHALGWVQDRKGLWVDPLYTSRYIPDVYSRSLADAVLLELATAVAMDKK